MSKTAAQLEKLLAAKDVASSTSTPHKILRGSRGEAKLNAAVVKAINHMDGALALKHVASAFTPPGHSDVYGCYNGRAFFLEGKVDVTRYKVTGAQHNFLKVAFAAGAIVGVYTSVEEATRILASGGDYQGHWKP